MTHGKLRKNRSINLEDDIVFTLNNDILYLEEKIFYIPLDNTI